MTTIQRYRKLTGLMIFIGDFLSIPTLYLFSYWIRSKSSFLFFHEKMPLDRIYVVTHHLWFLIALHLLLIYLHGLYDRNVMERNNQIIGRSFRSVSLEILILVAVYFFRQDIVFPRSVLILLWIFVTIFTSIWHLFWAKIFSGHLPARNLLIVGMNESSRDFIKEIERLPLKILHIVGVLGETRDEIAQPDFCGYPILGIRDDLMHIVHTRRIDEVVISSGGTWQDHLVDQISKTDQIPTRICIIPTCYEILIGKINHLRLYDIPLIEMIKHPKPPGGKRLYDFVLALFLFIVTLPLIILTALIVRLTSSGPILYRQVRLGQHRIPFIIYKFRTLISEAEAETGPVLTEENDQRVTPVGKVLRKCRLDELPQLMNILKGEMSFVGPRPERPYFVGEYLNRIPGYGERFKALPGLTGLAQVNGGYATTAENKLKYDLAYIYNQSLYLDMRILLETLKVILTGKVSN